MRETVSSETFDEYGDVVHVPGLHTRSLVNVICAHFSAPSSGSVGPLHYTPYRHYWQHSDGTTERIYDELYTGDVWLEEHERIQNMPPIAGCNLERAVVAMMFGSDATHIGQFGQSYLWPIYLYFGNNSKWDRRRPSSRVSEHVAYIPKMSDEVKSQIQMFQTGRLQPALLAHCKREIFQSCWRILLDDAFVDAYQHGIRLRCSDGIERRLYPRIFTYSADYPEKVLIATIKDFSTHPYHRCLVTKAEISHLGLPSDNNIRRNPRQDDDKRRNAVLAARRVIYFDGNVVNSKRVEEILSSTSGVPTINAFSNRLQSFPGFNLYRMLTPDLMHEVELGVWKSLFAHLVRMLHTRGPHAITTFDSRSFREIATYPPDTIRKFQHNVSEVKKFAARDYEDVLQCCGPCFEGLFPEEDDRIIQELIFTMAHWHALAKLRMHTTTTIKMLRIQTATLARRLRRFEANVASHYATVETDREQELRKRREIRRAQETGAATQPSGSAKRVVKLNLSTYKLHGLGDYPEAVEQFGASDSYSSEISTDVANRMLEEPAKLTLFRVSLNWTNGKAISVSVPGCLRNLRIKNVHQKEATL
ncbi:hypothetical protein FRC08_000488 [Ceratobasidium sp. 394]|nr:hypothetical protein FRC08_000488 [Ceratobasidium sp. 394]